MRSGSVSEFAKDCNDYHGDQLDRRRTIYSINLINEVKEMNGGTFERIDIEKHLAKVISYISTLSGENKTMSASYYYAYSSKLCSNWEHF